jgi:dipicolinate synthase subunit B
VNFKGVTIGFGLSASHCTFSEVMPQIKRLVEAGANVLPILSYSMQNTDTKFGAAADWMQQLKDLTGNPLILSIVEAEPLGPSKQMDLMIVAPLTGSSTSRLANAMTDSPVLMAAKAQMRNQRPLILAISTNDGLGLNAANIAKLLTMKNTYFVPFGQDAPNIKANSLVARMELIPETCEAALQGKQLQPMICDKYNYMN